jgi:hypothetical protein
MDLQACWSGLAPEFPGRIHTSPHHDSLPLYDP